MSTPSKQDRENRKVAEFISGYFGWRVVPRAETSSEDIYFDDVSVPSTYSHFLGIQRHPRFVAQQDMLESLRRFILSRPGQPAPKEQDAP